MRICGGCNSEIGHGRYLQAVGVLWHPECFRCHRCEEPISDLEFSVADNRPYHKNCYKEQYHPRCDVCKHFIPLNAAGLIEYRAHPFWEQKYCPSHEHDGTTRCCSCERMEPLDAKYLVLDDDRKLCLECSDSAIMDTDECQPLYLEVQRFYRLLDMEVEEKFPLLLVEAQELNEAMEGEKSGHHYLSATRGLCLSEEQSVSKILRQPRFGNFRIIDMFTEPYRLIRRCEVTAILVLYGLPRLLTGSILAHEMMHAWLRLNGYFNLSADVEEGMCQLIAHMWLDWELQPQLVPYSTFSAPPSRMFIWNGITFVSSEPSSTVIWDVENLDSYPEGACSESSSPDSRQVISNDKTSVSSEPSSTVVSSDVELDSWIKQLEFRRKLGDFFKQQIESHSYTAYGEGFKEAKKAVVKYGLKSTLDHIRLTGCFPP